MPKGEYLQFGGQAIIKGVMMRSPHFFSVACRAPNGEIVQVTEALEKSWIGRQKWLRLPFLRGGFALIDSMALGIKAMRFAANVQIDPKYQPAESDTAAITGPVSAATEETGEMAAAGSGVAATPAVARTAVAEAPVMNKKLQDAYVGGTMFISLLIGFGLFVYLPNLIAELSKRTLKLDTDIATSYVSEVVKILFLVGYMALIGRMEEIRDVYKYHGAEHKAINTLEADQELILDNCKKQTRLHPRCGTSFMIIVLIISLLLFPFVPRFHAGHPIVNAALRLVLEILIMPVVAGLAYELLRLAGRFRNTRIVHFFFWPGLMTQYVTTKEPDESQIECALTALKAVVSREDGLTAPEPVAEDALESAPIPVP